MLLRRLEGPEYDRKEMARAMAELTDFLASSVENPTFRSEARAALATVRSWLSLKHILIAEFYETVGNDQGLRYHLGIAATKFPETKAAARAGKRLERLKARAREKEAALKTDRLSREAGNGVPR